jgi:hypothetical protein
VGGVKKSGGDREKRELKKTESEKRMMIPSPRGRNSENESYVIDLRNGRRERSNM